MTCLMSLSLKVGPSGRRHRSDGPCHKSPDFVWTGRFVAFGHKPPEQTPMFKGNRLQNKRILTFDLLDPNQIR